VEKRKQQELGWELEELTGPDDRWLWDWVPQKDQMPLCWNKVAWWLVLPVASMVSKREAMQAKSSFKARVYEGCHAGRKKERGPHLCNMGSWVPLRRISHGQVKSTTLTHVSWQEPHNRLSMYKAGNVTSRNFSPKPLCVHK
jgi:hypothetical protein